MVIIWRYFQSILNLFSIHFQTFFWTFSIIFQSIQSILSPYSKSVLSSFLFISINPIENWNLIEKCEFVFKKRYLLYLKSLTSKFKLCQKKKSHFQSKKNWLIIPCSVLTIKSEFSLGRIVNNDFLVKNETQKILRFFWVEEVGDAVMAVFAHNKLF